MYSVVPNYIVQKDKVIVLNWQGNHNHDYNVFVYIYVALVQIEWNQEAVNNVQMMAKLLI